MMDQSLLNSTLKIMLKSLAPWKQNMKKVSWDFYAVLYVIKDFPHLWSWKPLSRRSRISLCSRWSLRSLEQTELEIKVCTCEGFSSCRSKTEKGDFKKKRKSLGLTQDVSELSGLAEGLADNPGVTNSQIPYGTGYLLYLLQPPKCKLLCNPSHFGSSIHAV